MATIWKYELNEDRELQTIEMPYLAKILCVQLQRGVPCMWVAVDDAPTVIRTFRIVGTGQEYPGAALSTANQYVGTVQSEFGNFVCHVFEVVA